MVNKSFHLRSMTACGRGETTFDSGRVVVDLQSLNRKHLEISLSIPRALNHLEIPLRKKVMQHVSRGQLNVSINWQREGKQSLQVTPNIPLAKELKEGWEQLRSALNLTSEITLEMLSTQRDLLSIEEAVGSEVEAAVDNAIEQALSQLIEMKELEGEELANDLVGRIRLLEKEMQFIESKCDGASERYRLKLLERLKTLFSDEIENEERVLKEIALFAERVDISEEIVRFQSHLKQFITLLEMPLKDALEARGKRGDFLLQELMREINTIGAKASDLEIAQRVIIVKSELERMREQIQNVE